MVGLPQNVQDFVRSEAGSHLLLMMMEHALGTSLQRINAVERLQLIEEYGDDPTVELDLEILLNHLSRVRVVAEINGHAEENLISYWGAEHGTVFLEDARRYVMDALRIVPREHPERARAYKNLAYILLARNKTKSACGWIEKALGLYSKIGLAEPIEELIEMLASRDEQECKWMQEKIVDVLRKMEVERA